MKKTCAGCSTMFGVSHRPSTCGSFSTKSQASTASARENLNGPPFAAARLRSPTWRGGGSRIHLPCRAPESSRIASCAKRSAIATKSRSIFGGVVREPVRVFLAGARERADAASAGWTESKIDDCPYHLIVCCVVNFEPRRRNLGRGNHRFCLRAVRLDRDALTAALVHHAPLDLKMHSCFIQLGHRAHPPEEQISVE